MNLFLLGQKIEFTSDFQNKCVGQIVFIDAKDSGNIMYQVRTDHEYKFVKSTNIIGEFKSEDPQQIPQKDLAVENVPKRRGRPPKSAAIKNITPIKEQTNVQKTI